jgi:hypothetical protein
MNLRVFTHQKVRDYISICVENPLSYTDKKEKKILIIYKEIQNGAVAKSYMTNGFLIY